MILFTFIEDYYSSGISDFVFDEDMEIYSIVALHKNLISSNMTDWYSYKENSCFIPDDVFRVKVSISEDETALPLTMIHELTHVLDYSEHVTPYCTPAVEVYLRYNRIDLPDRPDFTNGVWTGYRKTVEE